MHQASTSMLASTCCRSGTRDCKCGDDLQAHRKQAVRLPNVSAQHGRAIWVMAALAVSALALEIVCTSTLVVGQVLMSGNSFLADSGRRARRCAQPLSSGSVCLHDVQSARLPRLGLHLGHTAVKVRVASKASESFRHKLCPLC